MDGCGLSVGDGNQAKVSGEVMKALLLIGFLLLAGCENARVPGEPVPCKCPKCEANR